MLNVQVEGKNGEVVAQNRIILFFEPIFGHYIPICILKLIRPFLEKICIT